MSVRCTQVIRCKDEKQTQVEGKQKSGETCVFFLFSPFCHNSHLLLCSASLLFTGKKKRRVTTKRPAVGKAREEGEGEEVREAGEGGERE